MQRVHDDEAAQIAVGEFAAGAVNGVGLEPVVGPRAERAVSAGAGEFYVAKRLVTEVKADKRDVYV